jgi:hypothetical protein
MLQYYCQGILLIRHVALVLLPTLVAPAFAQEQEQWATYEDELLGISIQYPNGWKVEKAPNMVSLGHYDNESMPLALVTIDLRQTLPSLDTNEELALVVQLFITL